MEYFWISICSSILGIIGYVPEIYNLLFNTSILKIPNNVQLIWISSNVMGSVYGLMIKNYYITIDHMIISLLNLFIYLLRSYKYKKYHTVYILDEPDDIDNFRVAKDKYNKIRIDELQFNNNESL